MKKLIVSLFIICAFVLGLNKIVFASSGVSLFFSKGCSFCHVINGYGGSMVHGPDLSHVGSKRSLSWIKTQITDPSAHFAYGSSVTINGKSYIANMPRDKYMSASQVNTLAIYLESLGGVRDNNKALEREFNRRTDEYNNIVNEISPNTMQNVSTLLSAASSYVSFLRSVIGKTGDYSLKRTAERNMRKTEDFQNALWQDRQNIVSYCNQSGLESPYASLQRDARWNSICGQ